MTTVANTNNTNTNADGTRTTVAAQNGLNSNYQDFLKLLTTQLKNQDPTAPLDTNQITQQIAMLSQVEQQINTNTNLQQLLSMFSASQTNAAVSYIGKQIDAEGNQGQLYGGKAQFVYDLPAGAQSATVTISDSKGNVVFTGPGTTIAGRNQVIWDGTNSRTGEAMPAGAYTFKVEGKDGSGKAITATTYTSGVVTAADMQNGSTTLSLGYGMSVPMNNVKKIYNPGTNPEA